MNGAEAQKAFLPMFVLLLAVDFLVQLANAAGLVELAPLTGLWSGPLDDIFYGVAGSQALYFLLDPPGQTRDGPQMSWTATVKRVAALLADEASRRAYLPKTFFTGSLRSVALLGDGLLLAVLANALLSSVGTLAFLLLMQRHLSYLLPVALLVGCALLWALEASPGKIWLLVMSAGFGALVISMIVDGRWANHVHHLLAAVSNLQAWGAAMCWIAAGASLPMAALQVDALAES